MLENEIDLVFNKPDCSSNIRLFVQISQNIPDEVLRKHGKLLKAYFKAQVRIKNGQLKKASRLLGHLDRCHGLLEFEKDEQNRKILADIDIAVRGKTNRSEIDLLNN